MVSGERRSEGKGDKILRPFAWRKGELEGLSRSTSPGGGIVIIAADVIYDEGLTDAFFDVLKLLMPARTKPPTKTRADTITSDCNCDHKYAQKGAGRDELAAKMSPTYSGSVIDSGVFDSHTSTGNNTSTRQQRSSSLQRETTLYLAIEKRFNFSLPELSVAATGYNALLRNVLDVTMEAEGRVADGGCTQQGLDSPKAFEGKRLSMSFQQCFRYQRSSAMELWEIKRTPECNYVET